MIKKILMASMILALLVLAGCANPTNIDNSKMSSGEQAQVVYLGLDRGGYTPREITVEANKPVTLKNDGTLGGCGLYLIQPELGLNANFAKNSEHTFTPTKKGKHTFTCSMGMFKGTMNVV